MSSQRKNKRRRHANSRFIVFLAIATVVIVAVVLLIVKLTSSPDAPANATVDPSTQATDGPEDLQSDSGQADNATASSLAQLLGDEESSLDGISIEDMAQVEDLSINSSLSTDWMNVLLLGTDERKLTEGSRTDAMIVCSINTKSGDVKLTSIMRDLAVDFTDIGTHSGTYRINSANYFGGPRLAMKTVNECFNLNIENYVMVNFFGFQQVAEQLGGIDIDITQEEMEQINDLIVEQYKIAKRAGVDETGLKNEFLETCGENTHLDGRQTLAYSRIRKIDSDYSRAERQRTVLTALMKKLDGKSAMDMAALGLTLQQYITTNLSIDEILNIAMTVYAGNMEVEQFRLPVNSSFSQEERNGQAMLYDCDWSSNSAELYSFIYE